MPEKEYIVAGLVPSLTCILVSVWAVHHADEGKPPGPVAAARVISGIDPQRSTCRPPEGPLALILGSVNHSLGADVNTPTISPPFSEKLNIHDVVSQLNSWLGTTLVAVLSGATDKAAPEEWADQHSLAPSQNVQNRLWSAHRVWKNIASRRSDEEARLWFTGANPILERSPVLALRIGMTLEVEEAASAFLDGSWSL
ncbi:hypothetical protein [Streptomyces bobili]|uniref:Uncharacterized protein n=1 Tax=Streptomyces bobili TaxID=67280 RepID=A0ABZ1QYR9_9ACTN|nr:hypothetical protein [Streptomyces bobili]